jgi:tetratricopeptide (TPR) repeat protein
MSTQRIVKVFIASPGDLAVERRAFKEVVDELNGGYGRGAHVTFEPLGWEDALSTVGRRSQSVINQDIDACHVFVLVMWRRWGQEAPDAAPYTSYTEEEFYRALARFEKDGKPTIFVFFKHIDPGQMADPGEQLKKVLAFRKQLEETRKVLYRPFDDDASFREEIDRHLVGFAEGQCETMDGVRALPIIPDSILAELNKHQAELQRAVEDLELLRAEAKRAQEDAEQARAQAKDAAARAEAAERVAETSAAAHLLALAEEAAKAALDGKIEEARQGFAKALDGTTNLHVLFLGFEFFRRIGELEEAEQLLRRGLAISGPDAQTAATGAAYGNLGLVLRTRGDLDGAEAMHRKSLAIAEKLGRLEGMVSQYGNLGVDLGTRGDLDGAEEMFRKALAVAEKLGRLEGMANAYGNLGVVLQNRGNLDGAEAMHRKALVIDEKLGRLEGMANQYGNLGIVLKNRGDLGGAEKMLRKSLAMEEKLGRLEGMATAYGNLGVVLQTCGDLDGGEEMLRKALAIEKKLGRLEGMANAYGNLGLILKTRDDLHGAREMWSESRELFARLGARPMVDRVQGWIDSLAK